MPPGLHVLPLPELMILRPSLHYLTVGWLGPGYVALALMNLIAPVLLDENNARGGCYYAVLVFAIAGLVATYLFLKDTSHLLDSDVDKSTDRVSDSSPPTEIQQAATTSRGNSRNAVVELPGGGKEQVNVSVFAFVYTSFMKPQLMVINLAGLTVNFIAAMAWGLLLQWLKQGSDQWGALDKASVASITLAYDLTKGLGQFGCGFLGDRIGRKPFIVGGLGAPEQSKCIAIDCLAYSTLYVHAAPTAASVQPTRACMFACVVGCLRSGLCSLSLVLMSLVGSFASKTTAVQVGFTVGALGLGIGTTMMYSNLLAAVADEVAPSWRASALGTCVSRAMAVRFLPVTLPHL